MKAHRIGVAIEDKWLVHEASLTVNGGEVVGIVGPNGAGKSTLLSVLTGERSPSAGQVILNGRPLPGWNKRELARWRSVLPQQSTLSFGFRVRDVVLMGRSPHVNGLEQPSDFTIVEDAMRLVHIQHLADRVYTSLSGGERQRVHLARVLAQIWEPVPGCTRWLFLDEPTNNLDVFHQHITLSLAQRFARQDIGVVVVLHDLNLAAQYADRLIVMKNGHITAQGTPETVLTPAVIHDAFAMPVIVQPHPCHNCPLVIPIPLQAEPQGAVS
ncbi:MAG: heme ABC transporter ATP-binding protein [Chloroflexi bacterium]|nr:heme ABC transporter ATP-binding protein [Chloroflexota bacterium]